jgi:glycosyltransferase involved in cell wall biosynthesis
MTETLGISEHIEWVKWVDRSELPALFIAHDALLFPSLHDSGGMVVLEAMSHGLPVVCLDIGGPGAMVDDTCGRVIRTDGMSETEVVCSLSDAMACLAKDVDLRRRLSEGAMARAEDYDWSRVVRRLYSEVSVK